MATYNVRMKAVFEYEFEFESDADDEKKLQSDVFEYDYDCWYNFIDRPEESEILELVKINE